MREESLAPDVVPSVLEDEAGDQKGGSAGRTVVQDQELDVENIISDVPRVNLAVATKADCTLNTARALADNQAEGYYWHENVLLRTRLDRLGYTREQLCLPTEYRAKCLRTAHELFGHIGRNKMEEHIRQFFYWPSITANSMTYIRSCSKCQKMDKTLTRRMYMQE